MTQSDELADLFVKPATAAQRQYEALRAHFVEQQPQRQVAERFGYTYGTVWNLCAQFRKTRKVPHFTPPKRRKARRLADATQKAQARAERTKRILVLRRDAGLSAEEIAAALGHEQQLVSVSTVMKTLQAAGVPRLHRRMLRNRLDAPKPGQAPAADRRLLERSPRKFRTHFGGLFLFALDLARNGY